jgi:hypothetical protein
MFEHFHYDSRAHVSVQLKRRKKCVQQIPIKPPSIGVARGFGRSKHDYVHLWLGLQELCAGSLVLHRSRCFSTDYATSLAHQMGVT